MKLDSVWAATVASLLAEEEEKRAAVAAEPAAKKASEMDALAEQNRLMAERISATGAATVDH